MASHLTRGGRGSKKKLPKLGSGKRFERLQRSFAAKRGEDKIDDPAALAAAIGRKKFGKKRFAKLSSGARRKT